MTLKELKETLDLTGLPVAYRAFPEKTPNPVICFYEENTPTFKADNTSYEALPSVIVELYTDSKDPAKEALLEGVLNDAEIAWDKDETYVEDEKTYLIYYYIRR